MHEIVPYVVGKHVDRSANGVQILDVEAEVYIAYAVAKDQSFRFPLSHTFGRKLHDVAPLIHSVRL